MVTVFFFFLPLVGLEKRADSYIRYVFYSALLLGIAFYFSYDVAALRIKNFLAVSLLKSFSQIASVKKERSMYACITRREEGMRATRLLPRFTQCL